MRGNSLVKRITLGGGKVALVDDRDYALVEEYAWFAHTTPSGKVYARHDVVDRLGRRRHLLMHRLILDPPKGMTTDHRDGNGLNNRRRNLRPATMQQNIRAKGPAKHTSRYKGVSWDRKSRKWRSQIEVGRRKAKWLGLFASQRKAALAYDRAARRHFGRFAYQNLKADRQTPHRGMKASGGERGGKQNLGPPAGREFCPPSAMIMS